MIMSVWGIIFLGLLGVFFCTEAVTLFEDLPEPPEEHQEWDDRYKSCLQNKNYTK